MDLGRVTILRHAPLGSGAFGCVFKAFDPTSGQFLAVKECRGELNTGAARSLAVEFETLSRLHHPNIVRVFGIQTDTDEGDLRLYLEWLPGGSLVTVARCMGGALHETALRAYFRDMLSGLAFLHEHGIVHRDVKPGNLLLDGNGRVKLSDFGTRKALQSTQQQATVSSGGVAGTPAYMDANALQGNASAASDVWAAACTIVELSSGLLPWSELEIDEPLALMFHIAFQAQPPDHHPLVPDHLSAPLQAVLQLCFAHVASDRPSAAALLQNDYFTTDAYLGDLEPQAAYQQRVANRLDCASNRARAGSSDPRSDETLAARGTTFADAAPVGVTFTTDTTIQATKNVTDLRRCARLLRGLENVPEVVSHVLSLDELTPDDKAAVQDFITFDDGVGDPTIASVTLRSLSLLGRICWGALPNLKTLDLSGNSVDGQVNLVKGAFATSVGGAPAAGLLSAWQRLDRLTHIQLQCNALSGSIDLKLLPPNLVELSLRSNNFTGPLVLSSLPQTLRVLDVSRNSYSGFAELRFLPPSLTELNVSYNNLSGTVDFTQLPPSIQYLHLNNNHFVGCIDVSFLPKSIKMINVFSNRFGPPGRKEQYGSGIIGISARVLDYVSKERIKSMSPSQRSDPQLQTTPEEEAEILEEMADAFPASLTSLLLSANAFRYPRELSGMVRMGSCQVTL